MPGVKAVTSLLVLSLLSTAGASPVAGGQAVEKYKELNLCRQVEEDYYKDRERGWFYLEFCKHLKEKTEPKTEAKEDEKRDGIDWAKVQDPEYLDSLSAREFRELLSEVKEETVYHPDHDKVLAYIRMQDYMKKKSVTFSYVWRDVLLQNPELDPTVKNPVSTFGANLKTKLKIKERKEAMAEINRSAGIFFFVSGDCPYCHEEARIIQYLAGDYGMAVRTISSDHCNHEAFVACSVEPGLFDIFDVRTAPTLIAVFRDRDGEPVFRPIATGLVTEEEIVNRLIFYHGLQQSGEYPS